jgi:RimJ/RimL family protein N-acetyltransferase
VSSGLKARPLARSERDRVLAHLARDAQRNLLLMDVVASTGEPPAPNELASAVVCAWLGRELAGVAALRPSLGVDAGIDPGVLPALLPYLGSVPSGLLKCSESVAEPIWRHLEATGHRALIERTETAYVVRADEARLRDPPAGMRLRAAVSSDVDSLVHAARQSLREERRPDPFAGDPEGFRRWVRGRVPRARVVEVDGRIVFVGYADVRRSDGWLIQGVYTWEDQRRRGHAAVGMSALCREAFTAGADHVQLAVIDGNEPAIRLYQRLGFRPFESLRTVLFGRA